MATAAQIERQLKKHVADVQKLAVNDLNKFASDVFDEAYDATPVRTGRARDNTSIAVGTTEAPFAVASPPGRPAKGIKNRILARNRKVRSFVIYNPTPYFPYIKKPVQDRIRRRFPT